MKYTRFSAHYTMTKSKLGEPPVMKDTNTAIGTIELGSGVYNNGIYTILLRTEADTLNALVEKVFPYASGKISVFAVDWMGRMFATDENIPDKSGTATVTCFDFAEPSSFATDATFDDFHNYTVIDMMRHLLNLDQLEEWVIENPLPNDGVNCIGYKIPLFMGGQDNIQNMEICDRTVYLQILANLWLAIN